MNSNKREFLVFFFTTLLIVFATSCARTQQKRALQTLDQKGAGNYKTSSNESTISKEQLREEWVRDLENTVDELDKVARKHGVSRLRDTKPMSGDDFEIRIWGGFDLDPIRAIMLRNKNGRWRGKYLIAENDELRGKRKIKRVKPAGGWDELWKDLRNNEIESIQDEFDVSEVEPYEDSGVVIVEVLNRSGYRHYSYTPPCKPTNKEAKKLARILKKIRQEFKIKLTNCEKIEVS